MKIRVTFTGQGTHIPRTTREYADMKAADAANWAPIGTSSGRRLFYAADKTGKTAQYERNIVEVVR